MTTALETVEARRQEILDNPDDVAVESGKLRAPAFFPDHPAVNSAIAQGDLYLIIRDALPDGYTERTNGRLQLVPGETVGAKHCLTEDSECTVYDPPGFSTDYDELTGPVLVTSGPTEVAHPVHANVNIPRGTIVECRYQRTWDQEQRRERRARD